MSYVVGLTGGIGSGKTLVADAFAALGVEVIDTDLVAHRLSAAGQAGFTAILAEFGGDMLQPDGELDRAALRRLVFANARARARLEAALHPLIGTEVVRQIQGWRGAYILVVDCPEADQIRRVVARNGLSPGEVRAIMATQIDRQQRLAAADDVLHNSGPPEAIAPQVQSLDRRYRELAAASGVSG